MNRTLSIKTILLAGALLAAGAAFAGTPGESGFLSLRMPVGARETGMGGAGVAGPEGAAAVHWNPARAAFAPNGTDLMLQHQRSYGLVDREVAALVHRTDMGVVGAIFSGLYWDDIDRTTADDVGVPVGTFEPQEVALGGVIARQFGDRFALGAGVKLLHSEIDIESGTGFAYDIYASHRAIIEGLWFGASITNFGSDFTVYEKSAPLPMAVRLGVSLDPQADFFAGKLTLAGDLIMPNDGNNKAHVGAEFRLVPALSLRAGTKVNYESQGLTFGAGFRRGNIDVGYAYEEYLNDFDPHHRFSVSFAFSPTS